MLRANNIEELLELLHIDVIGREIESRHEMIRDAYNVPCYVACDYEDFKEIVTHYYNFHHACMLGVNFFMPRAMAEDQVNRILRGTHRGDTDMARIEEVIGRDKYRAAVNNAQRGRYRGLVGVLDDIKEGMKQKDVERYVNAVFLENFSPTDFGKRVAFAAQFLNMYGHLLLPGEQLMSAYELGAPFNFQRIITNYIRLINEFRKTVQ